MLNEAVSMDAMINPAEAFPTRHWRRLDDWRVECQICPRFCKLHEGQRGLCFVRGNVGGAVAKAGRDL